MSSSFLFSSYPPLSVIVMKTLQAALRLFILMRFLFNLVFLQSAATFALISNLSEQILKCCLCG